MSASYPLGNGFSFLGQGDTGNYTYIMSMPNAEVGDTYYLGLTGTDKKLMGGTALKVALSIKGNDPSTAPAPGEAGVESLVTGEGEVVILYDAVTATLNAPGAKTLEVYYVNGMKAPVKVEYNGNGAFADLSGLEKGILVVNAVGENGERKSAKVAR